VQAEPCAPFSLETSVIRLTPIALSPRAFRLYREDAKIEPKIVKFS